jgi:cytochrome c553
VERGEALFPSCQQCHGTDGEGNADIAAPPIAGLPAWYVEAQVNKFMQGARGSHPDDIAGMRMRPMAMHVKNAENAKSVAEYVATLPRPASQVTLKGGDAAKGQALFATCVACHQADGKGNQALGAPPLVGSADWYMLTQLKNFKSGVRGAVPSDTTGAQMAAMSNTLVDEQAMLDVLAHIATLK